MPMITYTTRSETNYTGILVKDKVCLNADTCANDYEFFAATEDTACYNVLGVSPS